jgi:1-acyl-sn-glycerol-3-phosphate acyltransferase
MGLIISVLRPLVWWFCRLMFKISFHGVENIPREGACLITPNHITYADPIWITIPIRRRVYFMAWDKPFDIPVLGILMRLFGAFPVNLEKLDTLAYREAADLLRRGKALVIFPEGGRSKTGKIMPFKMGAFRLALTHGVPIVPVTIDGAYEIWPVGKIWPRPGRLTITYHTPIEVGRVPEGVSRVELKERARLLADQLHDRVASKLSAAGLPTDDSQAGVRKAKASLKIYICLLPIAFYLLPSL